MRILIAVALVLQTDKPLFEEAFAGKLSDGWAWVREDAAAHKVEGGALKIKAQPGTLWFKTNTAKNLLLRKPPLAPEAEPLAIEVTVVSNPESNAEQAGLLVYADDGNYVKLVREALKGKINAVFAREVKGIPVHHPPKEAADNSFEFRIVWTGAKLSGFYRSADESEKARRGTLLWIHLGDHDVPPGAPLQVGLCAHGAAAEADRWATFKSFRVSKAAK